MTLYSRSLVLFTGLGILAFPAWSQGCVTLSDDVSGKCLDSSCTTGRCTERTRTRPALNPLSPGFFTTPSAGGYFITAIVPQSPAIRAGLLLGDQILSVDGRVLPVFYPLGSELWQARITHEVVIRRSGKILTQRIAPEPLDRVVSRAALDRSKQALVSSEVLTQAYLSGIVTKLVGDRLIVVAILRGTDAARAGVFEGDQIVTIDGETILAPSAAARIEGDDHRAMLRLGIKRNGNPLGFLLQMTSLTEVLYQLAIDDNSRVTLGGAF